MTQLDYNDGDVRLSGYLAEPSDSASCRGGVLIFPDMFGLGDHARARADILADMGFAALAVDPYGRNPTSFPDAVETMMSIRGDVDVLRRRARTAYDALAAVAGVGPGKVAATGYCFGGAMALELARSGADLRAVVTFHGGLTAARPADAANVKASVLICTGTEDPIVPLGEVSTFMEEMRTHAPNDWQVLLLSGAKHSFTDPGADPAGAPEVGYNATADKRSWAAMRALFDEVF